MNPGKTFWIAISFAIIFSIATLSSFWMIQRQSREVARTAALDLTQDLSYSNIGAAYRKMNLYKRLGQVDLILSGQINIEPKACLSRYDFSVIVDGLSLGLVRSCITFSQLPNALIQTTGALVIWIVALFAFLLVLVARSHYLYVQMQNEKANEVANLAFQVAHDIQSPLSALRIATANLNGLAEDRRQLILSALRRIQDISGFLHKKGQAPLGRDNAICEISELVRNVCAEKKTEYAHLPNVSVEADLDCPSDLFCKVNKPELSCAISNIVNNSVEALLDRRGTVRILLRRIDHDAHILIIDDGPGIPTNIVRKVGRQRGLSVGKDHLEKSGSGLGLYQARQMAIKANGRFEITSDPSGTQVRIVVPLVAAPA